MASLGVILGGIAVFGMGVNVTKSGIDAASKSDDIRKQIKDTTAQTDSLQSKWDAAIKKQIALDTDEKNEITDLLDDMAQLAAQARVTKRKFSDEYKKIQMAGVSFVIIIFFLLLLKWTGILDAMEELILSPFKKNKKK
jgi:hypothetical protein